MAFQFPAAPEEAGAVAFKFSAIPDGTVEFAAELVPFNGLGRQAFVPFLLVAEVVVFRGCVPTVPAETAVEVGSVVLETMVALLGMLVEAPWEWVMVDVTTSAGDETVVIWVWPATVFVIVVTLPGRGISMMMTVIEDEPLDPFCPFCDPVG